jgi:hypothetical protein
MLEDRTFFSVQIPAATAEPAAVAAATVVPVSSTTPVATPDAVVGSALSFTGVGADPSSVTVGETVYIAVDVTGGTGATPTGTVTIFDNGNVLDSDVALSGGTANITSNSLPAGANTITADYNGDSTYAPSVSNSATVDVGGSSPVTNGSLATASTLVASADIFTVGQSCNLTCTVASATGTGPVPTGTITLYEDGVDKATETLTDGSVDVTWTANTAGPSTNVDFVYSGDSNYTSSTSNVVNQAYLPLSQLTANITRAVIPSSNIAGQPLNARVPASFKNTGSSLGGPYTIVLYADTSTGGLSGQQVALETVHRRVGLGANRTLSDTLTAKKLPATLPAGTYYLLVEITDPDGNSNLVNTSQTIAVTAPFVALAPGTVVVKPATVAANHFGTVTMVIANNGNIAATGYMNVTLELSTDGVTASSGFAPQTTKVRINIPAHKTGKASIRFKVPAALAAGNYYPLVTVSADGSTASAVGSAFTAG